MRRSGTWPSSRRSTSCLTLTSTRSGAWIMPPGKVRPRWVVPIRRKKRPSAFPQRGFLGRSGRPWRDRRAQCDELDGDVTYDLSKSPTVDPNARNKPVDWMKRIQVTPSYNRSVATADAMPGAGAFDEHGRAIPAEMLPRELEYNGMRFELALAGEYKPNAMLARGQTFPLPAGNFNRVYVLAAADGDQHASFGWGKRRSTLRSRTGVATSASGTTACGNRGRCSRAMRWRRSNPAT